MYKGAKWFTYMYARELLLYDRGPTTDILNTLRQEEVNASMMLTSLRNGSKLHFNQFGLFKNEKYFGQQNVETIENVREGSSDSI